MFCTLITPLKFDSVSVKASEDRPPPHFLSNIALIPMPLTERRANSEQYFQNRLKNGQQKKKFIKLTKVNVNVNSFFRLPSKTFELSAFAHGLGQESLLKGKILNHKTNSIWLWSHFSLQVLLRTLI